MLTLYRTGSMVVVVGGVSTTTNSSVQAHRVQSPFVLLNTISPYSFLFMPWHTIEYLISPHLTLCDKIFGFVNAAASAQLICAMSVSVRLCECFPCSNRKVDFGWAKVAELNIPNTAFSNWENVYPLPPLRATFFYPAYPQKTPCIYGPLSISTYSRMTLYFFRWCD